MEKGNFYGGVILLKTETEILVTDIYEEKDRENIWKEWLSAAIDRYRESPKKNGNLVLEDYHIGNTGRMEGRSDKQVAFLLGNFKPDRSTDVSMAAFANRKKRNVTDTGEINRIIEVHKGEYAKFMNRKGNTASRMTAFDEDFGKRLMPGNMSHAERVFTLKGNFSFMGRERIRNAEDVAWIFRQLESKSTEHSFIVMTKGKECIILETGIGSMLSTAVDVAAAVKANKKFKPEKIYLVHNHPSGRVLASMEDKELWMRMKESFGNKLQPGIILNSDTGAYGIFSDSIQDCFIFDERQKNEDMVEIPVFSFDRMVFNKEYKLLDMMQITCSRDVAMFLSSQRFGEREKYAFLVLNANMKVLGNFHIPVSELSKSNLERIADYMADTTITAGGCAAIIYGKDTENRMMMSASYLNELVNRASGRTVKLADCVISDGIGWKSASDEGILENNERRPFIGYEDNRKVWQKIDIIPTADGTALIRVKMDGNYLPAERLRKNEMKKFIEGKLSKEELAEKYFPKGINELTERGLKR